MTEGSNLSFLRAYIAATDRVCLRSSHIGKGHTYSLVTATKQPDPDASLGS